MLLDIIIPQFNENDDAIKPLLDSLSMQEGVDFSDIKITIVNDCSNVFLTKEFLESYKLFNINYINNDKNTGPGLTRQKGVDSTDGQFIMFCDADDELYDTKALSIIIGFLKQYSPNYLVTNICVEVMNNKGERGCLIKKNTDTFPWMHGKVYKRSFLIDNEIKFSPYVRHLEDSYFTTCLLGMIDQREISYLDYTTYRWKINFLSLTRKKSKYNYVVEVFEDYFMSPVYTYEFLSKHKCPTRFMYLVTSCFGIYIMLNSNFFDEKELLQKKLTFEERLHNYIDKKRNIFILFKKEDLEKMFRSELKELFERNGIKYMNKDFNDFYSEYIIKYN